MLDHSGIQKKSIVERVKLNLQYFYTQRAFIGDTVSLFGHSIFSKFYGSTINIRDFILHENESFYRNVLAFSSFEYFLIVFVFGIVAENVQRILLNLHFLIFQSTPELIPTRL